MKVPKAKVRVTTFFRGGPYTAGLSAAGSGAGDCRGGRSGPLRKQRVADIVQIYADRTNRNVDLIRRAIQNEALPDAWRDYFSRLLQEVKA